VLAIGLLGQAGQAGNGGWRVGGPERLPLAAPLVGQPGAGGYRILWLGPWAGSDLPAPAGAPNGRVAAGAASVAFAVTLPSGASAFDIGRAATGPGYDALRRVIADILAGHTRHGGALLAPFGVRFVVSSPDGLASQDARRLSTQIDLDRVAAGDLTVFRNAGWAPLASVIPGQAWAEAAPGTGFEGAATLPPPTGARPIPEPGSTRATDGLVLLSQQFDGRWRLRTARGLSPDRPERAFGWAVGFPVRSTSGTVGVTFGGQGARDAGLAAMALLWAAALWLIRRPSRG
jgi:hypothetical protein